MTTTASCIALSRHTAEMIPGSELRIFAGRGHLTLGEELPSLAAEVLASGRR